MLLLEVPLSRSFPEDTVSTWKVSVAASVQLRHFNKAVLPGSLEGVAFAGMERAGAARTSKGLLPTLSSQFCPVSLILTCYAMCRCLACDMRSSWRRGCLASYSRVEVGVQGEPGPDVTGIFLNGFRCLL